MSFATFHDLKGQSVFISGGGSGIGAALTDGFLAQGCKVAFVQNVDGSDFCDAMEQKHGLRPGFVNCDVTDILALRGAMDQLAMQNGDFTVLVNNAANDQRHQMEGYTVEQWDQAMAVNLRHHYFAAQQVVPGMRRAGGGAIINYSSVSYMMGPGDMTSYITAKGAITAMTRGLARELGPDKIRANAVMPGWVLTPRQLEKWAKPDLLAAHLQSQCLKEHLYEEDMVGGTLFLASQCSRMMTGQALVIDGGVEFSG